MAKNTCKLCSRRFASPRALAGHMRSHSLAVAAAAAPKQQVSSTSSASTSFTTADEVGGFKKPTSMYALQENQKRSLRVRDGSSSDLESEVESTPPRAKRAGPAAAWGEAEPVSSLSEAATTEEDVALSLMKLSRDSWPWGARFEADYSDDGSDDGYAPPPPPRPAPAPVPQKRTQFQCTACKKVFRSYQALGGHRASNVRGGRGGCCAPPVAPPPPQPQPPSPLPEQHGDEDMNAKQLAHERRYVCGAAATAAQAATSAAAPPSPIKNPGMIDLNVEPPSDEVELSAVSDSRFNPGS